MAGKGGGAWKVAYADFVTAMMAFFLVMWLVSQDRKVRDAVSRYFMDPVGFYQVGTNKRPGEAGALFDHERQGLVPGKNYHTAGRGRGSHVDYGQGEQETKSVADHLKGDPDLAAYWADQFKRQREAAAQSEVVREKAVSLEDATRIQLAMEIERQMLESIPHDLDPVYRELLISALANVDWSGVADECAGDD
ncbi:MAG: hypothetical protein KF774_17570 [Planctomyces sp.]|nr:hypothetical protein [Planctomyces sp.]